MEWLHSSKLKFLYRLRVLEMDCGDRSEIADSNPIRKGAPMFMADDEKKREPLKPLTQDALRKLALSGKSVPSVKPAPPPEERRE